MKNFNLKQFFAISLFSSALIASDYENDKFTKIPRMNQSNQNQLRFLEKENIQNKDINFGIGPAGTGKTYLAVAAAVEEGLCGPCNGD